MAGPGGLGKGPNFRDFGFPERGEGGGLGAASVNEQRRQNRLEKEKKGGWKAESNAVVKEKRKGDRRLYCAARHVSFFLIIIFNPIHCMVQRFALTPTSFQIFQGFLTERKLPIADLSRIPVHHGWLSKYLDNYSSRMLRIDA